MTILNFGSCCIDHVYSVPHFAAPGESLLATGYEVHPGGKGLNQSLALAYAGATVRHAGKIGADGQFLKDLLASCGVDTSLLEVADGPSGHAVIQVVPEGENSIVVHGGSNRTISHSQVDRVLRDAGDEYLLIQNEISSLDYLIRSARGQSRKIIFNAAPMTDAVPDLPLDAVSLLIVNEVEGAGIAGVPDASAILQAMEAKFPAMEILLTLGSAGAVHAKEGKKTEVKAKTVKALDTTGAGDTFTGYFVSNYVNGASMETCLDMATRAAAICVSRMGAASSIPRLEEVG